VISPDKLGTFPVICAELCGLGHAVMRAQAVVMKPEEFEAWARRQAKALAGPSGQAGKAVFDSEGCGSCHTLKAAGASGKIGPDLDKLPAEAQQAGKPVEQFVRESIVDPNAYVAPGYSKNVMPQTYAQLPKSQLDALVQYLIQSSKQAGS
jgi:cytochrome c oxidase subunit 2